MRGKLVLLEMQEAFEPARLSQPAVLLAYGARIELTMAPADEGGDTEAEPERAADVVFSLNEGLRVGYRGWYDCRSTSQ
ncbi:hypothetical protein [Halopseudomonas sp.]|uniref:hypothetical protein n=1 Tax=Halopseudomonas sp. TaxID=2901191 RepID=UPI003566A365